MENLEEKYYAVLMSRVTVEPEVYIYKPITLIEGSYEIDEEYTVFTDALETAYLEMSDPETLWSDETLCVGYVIKKSDLINKYSCSLEECKIEYFDEICLKSHIGIYDDMNEKIYIYDIDLRQLYYDNRDLTHQEQLPLSQINEMLGGAYISFPEDSFKKMLDIESYDELHLKLQQAYTSAMNIKTAFNNGEIEAEIIAEPKKEEKTHVVDTKKEDKPIINVKDMKKFMDSRIIGQEEAKKDAILCVAMNNLSDNSKDRSACLFVGPTGSGKTLIAETISEYLNVPMEIIDTTQISMPGYEGTNIEDFLTRLLVKTNGDLKKAEEAIVVFDEIDKKGSKENSDVAGRGVLNALLPFIQGTTYTVKYNNRTVSFNTSKLTVFATGAFTDVAREKNAGHEGRTIGFGSSDFVQQEDIKYEKLSIEDLSKYGNIPIELLGRFSTITQLSGHTKESLRRILLESEFSPIYLKQKRLAKLGIETVSCTEDYIDAVVEHALKLKTGARSLKNTVEKSMKYVEYEVAEEQGKYKTIILTRASVVDNTNIELVDVDGNIVNLKDILEAKNNIEQEKRISLKIGG